MKREILPGSVLVLALAFSCARREPPVAGAAGPVEAVQAFAAAIDKGHAGAAWALLSSRTQKAADAQALQLGDAGPSSGRQLLFSSALPGGPVTVREISQDGGASEVAVSEGDAGTRTFKVVREAQGWKVDLDLH